MEQIQMGQIKGHFLIGDRKENEEKVAKGQPRLCTILVHQTLK